MLGIVFALGASLCWGSGDFLGGLSARRASLWAVIIGSQAVGLAGAALLALVTGNGWPGLHVVWPVLLGGLASVVAISCFYKALSIGSMSILAPISATNALIPFLAGIAAGERPGGLQLAGVALAAAGVLLVAIEPARDGEAIGVGALPGEPAVEAAAAASLFRGGPGPASGPGEAAASAAAPRASAHAPAPTRRAQRRATVLALIAAVCMGLVLIGYDATARYDPLWAMLGGRLSSAAIFAAIFVALRPRVKVDRSVLPLIALVGLLDTGANGLFALATTQGYLSIVSVLGSLYPVVTVLLAFSILRERLAPHQIAGAAATLAGVALVAAG